MLERGYVTMTHPERYLGLALKFSINDHGPLLQLNDLAPRQDFVLASRWEG